MKSALPLLLLAATAACQQPYQNFPRARAQAQQIQTLTPQQQTMPYFLQSNSSSAYSLGDSPQGPAPCTPAPAADAQTVQIALLLDTSGSMEGLINQAKTQLWSIVNDLGKGQRLGGNLKIQVALYEYGKSSLRDPMTIRQILPFTSDLEALSRELFALRTNGGEEYCGGVLQRALAELPWSAATPLRFAFVCGNEPFNQGPVDFRSTCPAAKARGIVVNTIHCGTRSEAERGFWFHGAELGGGVCSLIQAENGYNDLPTPLDPQIRALNEQLNSTYLPYGMQGQQGLKDQAANDASNASYNMRTYSQRAFSKSSKAYDNASWDLVDANARADFDLSKVPQEQLPANLRGLKPEEVRARLAEVAAQRQTLQTQLRSLTEERETLVKKLLLEKGQQAQGELEAVLLPALHQQAAAHGVTWPDEKASPSTTLLNPRIDEKAFLAISQEAMAHRATRRLSEADFLKAMAEKGTILLDCRSPDKFALLHLQGAINLPFPDISFDELARVLPDKNDKILIYCNNNFEGEPVAMASKSVSVSLNVPTYINLYAYGYRNVYELAPLLDVKTTKLPLVRGTPPPAQTRRLP
ncbi:MAG: hypothetical protein RL095_3645 [Verrucomicrobiota bacterium]|jgi:hypothetical protein